MTLVDTSAWVALFDRRDGCHVRAQRIWSTICATAEPLMTTDLLIAETITLVRRHAGFSVAMRVGARLLSNEVAEIVYADEPLTRRAWDWFERYHQLELSMADCVSFAVMRERRLRRAFTFDRHFMAAGFEPLEYRS